MWCTDQYWWILKKDFESLVRLVTAFWPGLDKLEGRVPLLLASTHHPRSGWPKFVSRKVATKSTLYRPQNLIVCRQSIACKKIANVHTLFCWIIHLLQRLTSAEWARFLSCSACSLALLKQACPTGPRPSLSMHKPCTKHKQVELGTCIVHAFSYCMGN